MFEQYVFSRFFTFSIGGGVGRFVPMVMVIERENPTGALGLY
jgi:hypothetical protein